MVWDPQIYDQFERERAQPFQMLEKARSMPEHPSNLRFEQLDIADWAPSAGVELVVTNAALQWVPRSVELMPQWLAALDAGAWFAMQVPHSAQLPSHVLLNRLMRSDRWRAQLGEGIRVGGQVASPSDYLELMMASGLEAQDWVRGTSLRPVIAQLGEADSAVF